MRRGWEYIDYSCNDDTGYLCSPVVTTRLMVSTTMGLKPHTRGRLEDVIWNVHHGDLSGLSYKKLTMGFKYSTSGIPFKVDRKSCSSKCARDLLQAALRVSRNNARSSLVSDLIANLILVRGTMAQECS